MPNKTSTKEFIPYILLALVILGAILTVVFLVVPWFEEISDFRQKTEEGEELLSDILKPKVQLLLNQDPRILDDNFKLAILALPEEQDGLSLMNTLEKMERAYRIEMSGITYSSEPSGSRSRSTTATTKTATGGNSQSTPVNLATLSDYSTLMALIEGFDNLLPLNEIGSVRFLKGTEGSGEINFSFDTSFYSMASGQTLSPSDPLESLTDAEEETLKTIQSMTPYPLVPVYRDPGKDNLFR